MNILLVSSPPSNRGGISNWVRLMHTYINAGKAPGVNLRQIRTLQYKNLKHGFWERYVRNGLDIFRIRRELEKELRTQRPDIIHVTVTGDWSVFRDIAVFRWARKHGIPSVAHIHFGKLPEYRKADGWKWRMLGYSLSLCSSIWAIDARTEASAREAFPDIRTSYVPNPIMLDDMPSTEMTRRKVISYMGWVVKTKGIEELLSAWSNVYAQFPEYQLQLIGPYEKDYREYLERTYSMAGVSFEGRMEHAKAMLAIASSEIFVLPSYTEGFPNAVLEAIALKTPVIASDVGAIGDMLADDCGVIIPSQDANALQSSLIRLMQDKCWQKVIAQNAYSRLLEEYEISAVFEKYKNEWLSLLKKNGSVAREENE